VRTTIYRQYTIYNILIIRGFFFLRFLVIVVYLTRTTSHRHQRQTSKRLYRNYLRIKIKLNIIDTTYTSICGVARSMLTGSYKKGENTVFFFKRKSDKTLFRMAAFDRPDFEADTTRNGLIVSLTIIVFFMCLNVSETLYQNVFFFEKTNMSENPQKYHTALGIEQCGFISLSLDIFLVPILSNDHIFSCFATDENRRRIIFRRYELSGERKVSVFKSLTYKCLRND